MKLVLILNVNNQYLTLKQGQNFMSRFRSSPPDVFLGKSFQKVCSKFTGENPCQRAISIKLPQLK